MPGKKRERIISLTLDAPFCYWVLCKISWFHCLKTDTGKNEFAFQANSGGTSLTSEVLNQEYTQLLLAHGDKDCNLWWLA